jgi:hypothetical protein
MKKLLALMLVLGLTSIATATNVDKLLQLSINGQLAPDEITLEPSDYITLDIMVADGHWTDSIEIDLEIIGPGSITLPDPPESIVVGDFESWSIVVGGITPQGIGEIVGVSFGQVSGVIVDYIEFHCDGEGDVIVNITNIGLTQIDGSPITEADMGSIIIHQIPEPASMLLLGLGGLLLRRRK